MQEKYDILREIFEIEDVFCKLNSCKVFSADKLLEVISRNSYNLRDDLGCAVSTTTKWLKKVFPDRPSSSNRLDNYLLHKYGYKECKHCNKIFELTSDNFHKNSGRSDGYNAYCVKCQNILTAVTSPDRQARYKASKLQRTPIWVEWKELEQISMFYANCPYGHHVDHILPLQGEYVSGLHVLSNLQYLPAEENCAKSNKFMPG